jgi:hypothetical protein
MPKQESHILSYILARCFTLKLGRWVTFANRVCVQFEIYGYGCLSQLEMMCSQIGAVDGIDHNPTTINYIHGKAISILQLPKEEKSGTDRGPIRLNTDAANKKSAGSMPAKKSDVPRTARSRSELTATDAVGPVKSESSVMSIFREKMAC